YFETLQKEEKDILGLTKADQKALKEKSNLPKAGWIVEVRGYTYYQPWKTVGGRRVRGKEIDIRKFVENTICHNLSYPHLVNPLENKLTKDEKDLYARQDLVEEIKFLKVKRKFAGEIQNLEKEKQDLDKKKKALEKEKKALEGAKKKDPKKEKDNQ